MLEEYKCSFARFLLLRLGLDDFADPSSEVVLVPVQSQAFLHSRSELNPFYTVSTPGGSAEWKPENGANVGFNTGASSVSIRFDAPYASAFIRVYGSVGPDHKLLNMTFEPGLPGIAAGSFVTVDPVITAEDDDSLLFFAPLDPTTRYKVSIGLTQGQVQRLSRVDFMSGLG